MATDALKIARDKLKAACEGDPSRANVQDLLLLSIAHDMRETLELARRNETYILQTMKEMGNGGTSNGPL